MGILKKIVTFRPSWTLRIVSGLIGILISLSVCTIVGINDQTRALNERDIMWRGRSVEQGAKIWGEQCARCHAIDGVGIEGAGPGLSNSAFIGKIEYGESSDGQRVLNYTTRSPRLVQLGYVGSLRDYVRSVTSSGLPIKSSNEWDAPHPPFLEDYGGPLRRDQIEDVTNFVINWGVAPKSDDQAIIAPAPGAGGAPRPTPVPLTAEQEAGKQVYEKAGCTACHAIRGVGNQGAVGPQLNNIAVRAAEQVQAGSTYLTEVQGQPAATTPEEYIRQSIEYPNAYIAKNCPAGSCAAGVMPQNLRTTQLASDTDYNNLIAYLLTLQASR
jgi:cytochrome c2